jgi:hypothetical protein
MLADAFSCDNNCCLVNIDWNCMSLFGKLVRTAINTATLPLSVVKDAVTMGDDYCLKQKDGKTATQRQIEKIKKEAEDA